MCRVRPEAEAVRGNRLLEPRVHGAGFVYRSPRRRVDRDHAIEMAGEVVHDARPEGVARDRRAGTTRGDGYAVTTADGQCGEDVVDTARAHHRLLRNA